LLLAIAVIPASFATHIVREREVKAKHQQIVSGVSFPIYWLSNWIWYLFFCFNVYLY
jgi:ATP-binding cassette subfamily A (ABC1) protein 3